MNVTISSIRALEKKYGMSVRYSGGSTTARDEGRALHHNECRYRQDAASPCGWKEPRTASDVIEIDHEGRTYGFLVPERPDPIVNTIASRRTFYEFDMLKDIRRRIGPEDLVLDIGAHVGNHAVYLAGVCGCQVLAFEPFQENFALLNANIELNGLGPRVKSLPIALGASAALGMVRLKDEQNRGSVVIDKVSHAPGIPIRPLDELELPRDPAVLKIDVEGAELEVLKGARSLLRRCRPLLYVETIDDDAFEAAIRLLDGFGYQVVACFNATPTFLFATTEDPRIGADERRLDRLFGRSCIRHHNELHELRVQIREKAWKLRQTKEVLRRTRRWLRKVMSVARRRRGGLVYRIRRALVTTTRLPGPIRRLFTRHLASRRMRRRTDSRVRSSGSRGLLRSPPASRSAALGAARAASPTAQTQPSTQRGLASPDLYFRDFFGLRLAFADRIIKEYNPLDGKRYILIGNPRKLFDAPDPTRCLLAHYGIDSVAESIVGMTSAGGGWYRAVARLKSFGVQSFLIMLDPKRNERLVAKRVAIPINAIRTIFIPNYKCGYASFRQFCFENFAEFRDHDPDRSSSLNRLVDFSECGDDGHFVFSTIRHPVTRFRSLYFDKFCRMDDRVSYNSFHMPFCSLLETDQLTPNDVLDVISKIPDEFSDAHWKSQHFNTTHNGRTLVDYYVRMEHMEEDLDEISRRVSFRFDLPKVLSTANIAQNHEHRSHFERESIREKLMRRYPGDFLNLGYS